MAIEENDREDLLRDAKMMPVRGETQMDGHTIVIGFRSDGQLSLYCDADPVFQFNAARELRRVYFQGERYSAERGGLVKLTRDTEGGKVAFHREDASTKEIEEIQTSLANCLQKVERTPADAWTSANDSATFAEQFRRWMQDQAGEAAIADSPNA